MFSTYKKYTLFCQWDLDLNIKSSKVKAREKKVVTKSFQGIGIVVPVGKDEIGYRPLHHTDGKLVSSHFRHTPCV